MHKRPSILIAVISDFFNLQPVKCS